jgi:hypothetical protein
MSAPSLTRICWFVLRASTAVVLTIAPYRFTFDGAARIGPAGVHAEDGGGHSGGGDGGGDGGDGDGGGGDSGDGGGDGGGDDGGDGGHEGGSTGPGNGHVNPATGDRVSIRGNTVQVVHLDGLKEKIENGRFVMKDALGRTIVERAATAADLARLKGL